MHAFLPAPALPHAPPRHPALSRCPRLTLIPSRAPATPPPPPPPPSPDEAVQLASSWARHTAARPAPPSLAADLAAAAPADTAFVMRLTDQVVRPGAAAVAARQLARLLADVPPPRFLSVLDRAALRLGGAVADWLPYLVMAGARLRVRAMVRGFIGWSSGDGAREWGGGGGGERGGGGGRNVNLLGEAVLGEEEAGRRATELEQMLRAGNLEYVSVKISGVMSQVNRWDFEGSLHRAKAALRPLFRAARDGVPRVLVNLDMEEYHDLELTMAAFMAVLDEPEFARLDAGIVLQAYLPDALPALQSLVKWANARGERGGEIKVRLVKGANLAMERVDAVMHGWRQATYETKVETDANYLRCLEWVMTPERTRKVRVGVATHNLFFLAYAHELASARGVTGRVGFENLRGMTPAVTPFLATRGLGMLLYSPVCKWEDFDVAISYLFRRFEETSAEGNFLRASPALAPGSAAFLAEERRFRDACRIKHSVAVGARRSQERPARASEARRRAPIGGVDAFVNEPDTDPALPGNRAWARDVLRPECYTPVSTASVVEGVSAMRAVLERARAGVREWAARSARERRRVLERAADVMARRRGELIAAMVYEGRKTFAEADAEVSEAVDFANYYARAGEEVPEGFRAFGVVAVVAPWNFPVAIAAGGVLAALAAGNAVVFKPASATPRCGELVAECVWEAGVPREALEFVQVPGGDEKKELIVGADAVILTGGSETARKFQEWKSDIRLFAETSGKNSMIISPAADLDLAVADLIASAFSSSGQKCSASSLAICIGDVYNSPRFRRQLKDGVESLRVGPSSDIATVMGPLVMPPGPKLLRALTQLDSGEEWLVEPVCLDADGEGVLWTPGVKLGVRPGSWFHRTEAFGPVLGIMSADTLQAAVELQNGTAFGLTGGIHTLDASEIDDWTERVEVGNAYVNRGTTGAIVQRQCFGGWKGSVVGPGAKAGGPNYVAQLGTIHDATRRDDAWLQVSLRSDASAWDSHFSREHDPSALGYETNVLRYRPVPAVCVRVARGADEVEARRVRAATQRCGVARVVWSDARDEDATQLARRLRALDVERVRVVGEVEAQVRQAAAEAGVLVVADDVVADGRVELLRYLREQSISRTRHRFGNMVNASASVGGCVNGGR